MSRTTILSAIILSAVLAACTDVTDSPIPVSDNKPWTIDENDKDTSYKPGDDFFMYCNGGYWKAHAASLAQDEPAIVSLARTDAMGVLNEQLATLERPSLQVMKCHATTYTPEQGEATMQQWLAPLTNATTLEEAWQATGLLMHNGLDGEIQPTPFKFLDKIVLVMVPNTNLMISLSMSPDEPADIPEDTKWPMIEAWCEGLDVNPENVMTYADWQAGKAKASGETLSDNAIIMSRKLNAYMLALQQMDLDDYKQKMTAIFREYNLDILTGDYTTVAETAYDSYCKYEMNYEYCHRYCDEASIQRTQAICEQLKQTFAKRIACNTWLSEATKSNVLEKLEAMRFFIGKPGQWYEEGLPDLSASTNLMEDILLVRKTRMTLYKMSLGPVGQFDIMTSAILLGTTSMVVLNSGYDTSFNAVFISPLFCTAPLNPSDVNKAISYAGCVTFGHEMTHAFDTKGYNFDKNGNPGNVMATEADYQAFNGLASRLIANYNKLEVMPNELPGLCNDGQATIGENIADMGGVELCYEAYTDKLKADGQQFNNLAQRLADYHSTFEVAPGVMADGQHTINEDIADLGGFEIAFQTYTDHLTSHGFHGDELRRQQWLFYQAYAHIWRARYTDAYAQERVTGDIHSLPRERVNALVPHTDAWYDLFNVKPGDNLYIAPENRVHIW